MNKQEELLDYIKEYIDEHGYAPSIREMRDSVGISSTSVVVHYLNVLSKNGFIKREERKARAIVVTE